MNWVFKSRSKNYYYEDSDECITSPPVQWHELPRVFLFILILPFLMSLLSLCGCLYAFYQIAKKTYNDGEPEFPFLAIAGTILPGILYIATSSHLINLSKHLFIMFWLVILIFFFTLAPLTGLCLRFFQLLFSILLKRRKP